MSDRGVYLALRPSHSQRLASLEARPLASKAADWKRVCLVLDELVPKYRGTQSGFRLNAERLSHEIQMLLLRFGFPLADWLYHDAQDEYLKKPVFLLKSPQEVAEIAGWLRDADLGVLSRHYLRLASPYNGYPGLAEGEGDFLQEWGKVTAFFGRASARKRSVVFAAWRRCGASLVRPRLARDRRIQIRLPDSGGNTSPGHEERRSS